MKLLQLLTGVIIIQYFSLLYGKKLRFWTVETKNSSGLKLFHIKLGSNLLQHQTFRWHGLIVMKVILKSWEKIHYQCNFWLYSDSYKEWYHKKFIRKSGTAMAVYLMGFRQKAHFTDWKNINYVNSNGILNSDESLINTNTKAVWMISINSSIVKPNQIRNVYL